MGLSEILAATLEQRAYTIQLLRDGEPVLSAEGRSVARDGTDVTVGSSFTARGTLEFDEVRVFAGDELIKQTEVDGGARVPAGIQFAYRVTIGSVTRNG